MKFFKNPIRNIPSLEDPLLYVILTPGVCVNFYIAYITLRWAIKNDHERWAKNPQHKYGREAIQAGCSTLRSLLTNTK
jgi:hypothetical protein